MTWYLVEKNGNVLTLSSGKAPSWPQFGSKGYGWKGTLQEAINQVRGDFEYEVANAERRLGDARADLARFLEVCPKAEVNGSSPSKEQRRA